MQHSEDPLENSFLKIYHQLEDAHDFELRLRMTNILHFDWDHWKGYRVKNRRQRNLGKMQLQRLANTEEYWPWPEGNELVRLKKQGFRIKIRLTRSRRIKVIFTQSRRNHLKNKLVMPKKEETETTYRYLKERYEITRKQISDLDLDPNEPWNLVTVQEIYILADYLEITCGDLLD